MKVVIRKGEKKVPARQDQPQKMKKSLVEKCMAIIRKDILAFINRKKLVTEPPPEKWQDYERFCEMARGKR